MEYFLSIKSKFILKKIFSNLNRNKWYNIIKYNKKLQNRMHLTLNSYKDIFEKIEIDVIPISKNAKGYNIFNKNLIYYDNKENYHIYVNDNNKETPIENFIEIDYIKKVKIIIDYNIKSLFKLFYGCCDIEKINFISFNRKDINDMSYMFAGCTSLKEINFYNFKTDNVTNMSFMFFNCFLLEKINFSKFNTNNVIDIRSIFDGCSLLEK